MTLWDAMAIAVDMARYTKLEVQEAIRQIQGTYRPSVHRLLRNTPYARGVGMTDGMSPGERVDEWVTEVWVHFQSTYRGLPYGRFHRILAESKTEVDLTRKLRYYAKTFAKQAQGKREAALRGSAAWRAEVRLGSAVRVRGQQTDPRPRHQHPDEDLIRDWEKEAVAEAIGTLPERYHDVMRLAFHDGMTRAEAGRKLGLPKQRVSERWEEGVALLRRRIDPPG
jgi:RNA polymerase sigma factor (sigma-70 family)